MNASIKRRNPIIGCASSKISPAAELIANNVDLLTQLLLCFPAKTLIRFKSVSKQWLSLISDSQFATMHSRQNPRPSIASLFLYWNYETESVSLEGDPNRPTLDFLQGPGFDPFLTRITHSCNGLLLCEYFQSDYGSGLSRYFLVCNPSTQTYALIPPPSVLSSGCFYSQWVGILAFDPLKSPHYKVVFLIGLYYYLQIDIYCSESASWKQIHASWEQIPVPMMHESMRHKVFCGGVIYWLSYENVIFGFDVDSEKKIEMKNLPKIQSLCNMKYFGECGGRLILIHETQTPCDIEVTILEMDKDYCRWIGKRMVDIGHLHSSLDNKYNNYSILCVVKGEMEADFALVLAIAIPGKVVAYNLECKTWKVLRDVAPGGDLDFFGRLFLSASPYIESLLSLSAL